LYISISTRVDQRLGRQRKKTKGNSNKAGICKQWCIVYDKENVE
jgi:hypothetical protein